MINRLTPWNDVAEIGNPTRSVVVNDMIKRVKKKEVRKQGLQSSARRALEHLGAYFECSLDLLENSYAVVIDVDRRVRCRFHQLHTDMRGAGMIDDVVEHLREAVVADSKYVVGQADYYWYIYVCGWCDGCRGP